MEGQDVLKLCIERNYTEEQLELFRRAIDFSREILGNEKRLMGDSYFEYNLHVACILAENNSEPDVIVAGILLHAIRHVDSESIKSEFGQDVLNLLEQVKELGVIKTRNYNMQAEALRKILLTTVKDIRVMIIKLASKLENMKSVHVFPPEEQKRMAEEVLEIYAPLAYRLGIEKIRSELEDLAFKILNPRKYEEINMFLEESRREREGRIQDLVNVTKEICGDQISECKVKGRPKHIHSIYQKIKRKGIRLSDLHDLLAIRIIVSNVKECYTILGLLHENFEPIDGRLKDYIANPKPNFYRSIHTSVKLPDGKIAEVQIRTEEMDEFAEEGIAAHWRYKGMKSDQIFERKIAWLRGMLDMQKSTHGKEFLETVKIDLFGDKMYCYTPRGDVKELPLDATVLDFAYSVHEEVGNTCVGGRVNGKFVPLKYKIQSGDVVEVVTNKRQRPRRSWIKIVTSSKARQKIRKSLKAYEKLAPFHFRLMKPVVKEEQGVLTHSPEFPKAVCTLARCCFPIPGDNVVGIVTKRRIISVHKDDCRRAEKEQERWVPVEWKETFNQRIKFFVEAAERSGLLADLLHTIANAGFEVKEAKAKLLGTSYAQCAFTVIPRDLDQLKELIRRVMKVGGVKRIFFE